MSYPTDMSEWIRVCHEISREKGWWPTEELIQAENYDPLLLAGKLALVHSEVSEALEEVRDGRVGADEKGGTYDGSGRFTKPEGFATELADVVIRVFDLAGACGIDLEQELATKCAYNRQRPYRHGGKKL